MTWRCLSVIWRQTFWALIVLCGCASTHNLKTDGSNPFGGGFADQEIVPGLYYMTAIGNTSPWPSFSAAIGTWRGRADQLCGKDAYQELTASTAAGFQGFTPAYVRPGLMLDVPKYNTSISGYILCASSRMTRNEAIKYLTDLAATKRKELIAGHRMELEKLGGGDCGTNDTETSAETFFRRGKVLSATDDYKSAMNCFMRAQEREQGTAVYRDSCSAIGTMYELGWGVEKDISTAMAWFRKAGL